MCNNYMSHQSIVSNLCIENCMFLCVKASHLRYCVGYTKIASSHIYSLVLFMFLPESAGWMNQNDISFTPWPKSKRRGGRSCGTDDFSHWLCWAALCCARVHGWAPGLASVSEPGPDFQRLHDEFPKDPERASDKTALNVSWVCTQLSSQTIKQ